MTLHEACETTDEVKRGYYVPLSMRQVAQERLERERLEIHGQWRDGEISLRSRLAQQEILSDAIAALRWQ